MGKKKKKEHAAQRNGPVIRKPHDSTVFELAFLEAETQKKAESIKKTDVAEKEVAPVLAMAQKVIAQTNLTVSRKSLSVTKSALSVPFSPKEKRVYISPPEAPKKQQLTGARQQHSAKKKQNQPTPAPPTQMTKPPVNLGLKPVPNKMVVLDIGTFQGEEQKHESIKSHRMERGCGRDQAHDGTHNDESDIVIGFDFGTSCSKIVIRDSGRQTAYAVPFDPHACSGNSYLIPTCIVVSDDGSLNLPAGEYPYANLSAGEYPYANLKIDLMDNPEQCIFTAANTSQRIIASELAAAYMALVIRFARVWFLKNMGSIYKKTHIHWHINLGIPSKNYDDQEKRTTFQAIAMVAWRISRLAAAITVADVKKIHAEAGNHIATVGKDIGPYDYESIWLHPDFVNTHPEVIMEVVGYARSPLRTNGLHLLIDVGATTLDAATFIIYSEDGEDVYPLLETSVARHGTMVLHNYRIQALKISLEESLKQKKFIDPTKPLPVSTYYEIMTGNREYSESDVNFFYECSAKIGEILRITKKCRDPLSRAWEKGLPVFICGGGGRVPAYREMISKLGASISDNLSDFKGFDIKGIPQPDQLEAPELPHDEYDRLAVAYGLSFTLFEIGEVVPKSKVSDIHKVDKTSNVEGRFVSKDMC